jgi:hypothetical protein
MRCATIFVSCTTRATGVSLGALGCGQALVGAVRELCPAFGSVPAVTQLVTRRERPVAVVHLVAEMAQRSAVRVLFARRVSGSVEAQAEAVAKPRRASCRVPGVAELVAGRERPVAVVHVVTDPTKNVALRHRGSVASSTRSGIVVVVARKCEQRDQGGRQTEPHRQ